MDYHVIVNHISEYLMCSSNHGCWCITVSLLYDAPYIVSYVTEKIAMFLQVWINTDVVVSIGVVNLAI